MKYTHAGIFSTLGAQEPFKKKRRIFRLSMGLAAVIAIFVLGSLTSKLFDDADGSGLSCNKSICEINWESCLFGYCVHTETEHSCNMRGADHCYASACSPS